MSIENADIVVNAPIIPVPRNNAKSDEIMFWEVLRAIIPSRKEPAKLTVIVAIGNVSYEIQFPMIYLNPAPIAPPNATRPICWSICCAAILVTSSLCRNIVENTFFSNRHENTNRLGEYMGRKIWFLTGNIGKVEEAREYLTPLGYEVSQLIVPKDAIIEPQSDSITDVAMAKIEQAKSYLPLENESKDMLMIEDAGLFIDSLSGFPGVYSSYVHQTIGCEGIIKLLSHLTTEDSVRLASLRSAEFRAVTVLWDDGEVYVGNGKCPGYISTSIVEGNGFGYDPIFVPYDLDSDGDSLSAGEYGEVSTHGSPFGGVEITTKKKFSHRSRALNDLFNQLPSA